MFDLFIIGAGFSAMSGAPKEKDILPEIFRASINTELFQSIQKILFPGNPDWVNKTSFNEIISRLDLIRYYQPYPNLDYDLVTFTEQRLLKQMVLLLKPENTRLNPELYSAFVSKRAAQSSFLSFNYDLVLESALKETNVPFNRGLRARSLNHTHWEMPQEGQKTLLKLHGSVDLLFCSNCREIFRTGLINDTVLICPFCREGNSFLQHFLIAPTLYKSYQLPAIRDIWYKALQLLINSNNLCFIGYSLPDGDILTYQLLDTAYRLSGGKQSACLVNGPRYNPAKFADIYGSSLFNTHLYFQEWMLPQTTKA